MERKRRQREQGLLQERRRGRAGLGRRVFAVIAWACVMAYFILSEDPFGFRFSPFHPTWRVHWRDLLILDLHVTHPLWLISKLGHITGFFVMDRLLHRLSGRRRLAAGLTFALAVCTECLQLWFGRDGRLYDMAIDGLGIALAEWAAGPRRR